MSLLRYFERITKAWNLKLSRPFVRFAIEKIEEHWNDKNIFIIEAPTGYGKSTISATIAIYSVSEELKAIICYPLRTLIEDQYDAFTGKKRGKNAICDVELVGVRYMHNPDSRYLIKPITLTTVDTLALTLFGIAPEDFEKALKAYEGISFSFGHYMFSWASAILSNVVLDEVHLLADSTKSLNFLIALLKLAIRFNQRLVLMSATLPKAFKEILLDSLRGDEDKIAFITFSKSNKLENVAVYNFFDENFVEERMNKSYDIEIYGLKDSEKLDKLRELVKANARGFKGVLVVFNTVDDAINFYKTVVEDEEILKAFGNNILLLHSRFTELDRRKKNEMLKELRDKFLVISTQVIEAGVDISSDLFITEIAPANSLIQRLGRFLRYDEKLGKVIVWYETDDSGELKLTFSLNRKPNRWLCVDTEDDEIFEKSVAILSKTFKNVEIKKLSDWKGKKDYLAVAVPTYKVYNYELTLRTLDWLKKNKLNVHVPGTLEKDVKGYKELLDHVYSKKDFRTDHLKIEELLKVHDHLENPKKAVELLLELEGSFVRDEMQVNVIPEDILSEFVGKSESELGKLLQKFCIPISVKTLRSLTVTGYLFVGRDGNVKFKEIEKTPLDTKAILTGVWVEDEKLRVSPVAFVAKVHYDNEVGLRVEK